MHAPIIVINLNYTRAERGRTAEEFYRGIFCREKKLRRAPCFLFPFFFFFYPRRYLSRIYYVRVYCVVYGVQWRRARSGLPTFRIHPIEKPDNGV